MLNIKVKWNKEIFPVEVDTSAEAMILKAQMYALSNVPVETQKIMIKGKILKDDADMSKVGLTNGMTVMMMGTAEDKGLKEPTQAVKFFEDMTPEEKARALNQALAVAVPPGLTNLGNTCYMAATLQMLKRVDELKKALKSMNAPAQAQDTDGRLAFTGGKLMQQLEMQLPDVQPLQFLQSLQTSYPMFAERTQEGHQKQQDADECFQSMLQSWRAPLKKNDEDQEDVIGNLFEIELENTLKCQESEFEESSVSHEKVLRLSCHIDNNNKPIDMIQEGLKISLEGQIEKNSPSLGRNALYLKQSKINRLPAYLCV